MHDYSVHLRKYSIHLMVLPLNLFYNAFNPLGLRGAQLGTTAFQILFALQLKIPVGFIRNQ